MSPDRELDGLSEPGPRVLDPVAVRFGADGLVAAVVQDAGDGRVLMVGWQDAEALEATLRTGEAHFHSRSRDHLWRKGESSGNVLRVAGVQLDCDADAILLLADPAGPTCHTDARSCFDEPGAEPGREARAPTAESRARGGAGPATAAAASAQGFDWLETLWATIEERSRTRPKGSYTARLLGGGVDAVARKVTEEATEVLLAAKDDAVAEAAGTPRDQTALARELADLLYHALALCAERSLSPREVIDALRRRHSA